jgi:hypothetical protein
MLKEILDRPLHWQPQRCSRLRKLRVSFYLRELGFSQYILQSLEWAETLWASTFITSHWWELAVLRIYPPVFRIFLADEAFLSPFFINK